MDKFYINVFVAVLLLADNVFAVPSNIFHDRPNRTKRSFFSSFFGSATTTEPSPALTETIVANNHIDSQTPYLIPRPNDPNIPPSFVPVVPVRYFASPTGQHYIAVRPVNINDPNVRQPENWSSNNIPMVNNKPRKPPKKVESQYAMDLSPSQIAELNQLAKKLGVRDVHDLPPLEEVMILLGTTSKSETIKAVRDYASTPSGLELIKDYVMSYQPVKRMDTFVEAKSDNEATPVESFSKLYEENSLFPNEIGNRNSYQFPIIGYSQLNDIVPIEDTKTTTPAPDTGFFAGLRSFFSFGSTVDTTKDADKIFESSTIPRVGTNLVPHFIIPLRPLAVGDSSSYPAVPDFQRNQLTPFIQDMNPFELRSYPSQHMKSNVPFEGPMDPKLNEAHIYNDDTAEQDITDESSGTEQHEPLRISPPEEPTGHVHKISMNEEDLSIIGTHTSRLQSGTNSSERTTAKSYPTDAPLNETTTLISTDS